MQIVNWNDVDDDMKIVRFVDSSSAKMSLGEEKDDGIRAYTFPINLLSYYKNVEDNRGDPQEGETRIYIKDGVQGSASHTNESLISCWSFWDEKTKPWESLKGSSFVDNEKDTHVLVSTVGKVKNEINKIISEFTSKYVSEYMESIIFSSYCGAVTYYKQEGVDVHEYNLQTNGSKGVGFAMIYQIYNKPEGKKDGHSFSAEKECRFSIILNGVGEFLDPETGKIEHIKTIAKKLSYFPLQLGIATPHYIDDIIKIPR